MVGLVLVSHSQEVADALVSLVKRVSSDTIPIAGVMGGGSLQEETTPGAKDIIEAVRSVHSIEGVLILADSGATLRQTETVLHTLPDEMRSHIRCCAAPLVEGAIAAGQQICLGHDLETVYWQTDQAFQIKLLQRFDKDTTADEQVLPHDAEEEDVSTSEIEVETGLEIIVTIHTPHGIHIRPAARFVQTAASFEADIFVRKLSQQPASSDESKEKYNWVEGEAVQATSLINLMSLEIVCGDRIAITAKGTEASQALDALRQLVEEDFGEDAVEIAGEAPKPAPARPVSDEQEIPVIPLSDGIAIGPAFHYRTTQLQVPEYQIEDPILEWERLQNALTVARRAITQQRQRVHTNLGKAQSAIFDAHLLILDDHGLLEQIRKQIFQHHQNAAKAWNEGITEIANSYRSFADPYLQQRADDVADVGNQVLSALLGEIKGTPKFTEAGIFVVQELSPMLIAQLDINKVRGLITMKGGPTDHGAILTRALGLPTVAAPSFPVDREKKENESRKPPSVTDIPVGATLAIDGFNGVMWMNPSSKTLDTLHQFQADWEKQCEKLLTASHEPATTHDGHNVRIMANGANVLDAKIAIRNGAEGIGILRTEFLYLTRNNPPSEEEQLETLSQIVEVMGVRPVYVRTLDVGGDKAIPYLNLPLETNPFLGVRSIRLSLRTPDLFHTQLRAILRAGEHFNIRIMFPMISMTEEIGKVLECLEQAHQSLKKEQILHQWPVKTAMMVETPSAALLAASFVEHVEYFSIGTNDLTQYTLAAERGNPELVSFADGLHPSVLMLIRAVIDAAHPHGKHVGICGELAGDPVAVPVLMGLGVDELSMNPGGIPRVKDIIRRLNITDARTLAENALKASRSAEVRRMAEEFVAKL